MAPAISADAIRYALYDEDQMLVRRFVALIMTSSDKFKEKMSDSFYKMVLRSMRLLHLCDYHYADVILVMAHTSVYFSTAVTILGAKMDQQEAAHVCALLMYLAHSFALDETCPMRCWQKHLFRQYCTVKVLNAALFRLFKMRRYILRITPEEERMALLTLSGQSPEALGVAGVCGSPVKSNSNASFRTQTPPRAA